MAAPMTEIEARVAIAQATLDEFRDRAFEFGKSDGAMLVKWHARRMGCPVKTGQPVGNYTTLLGMKRALRRIGVERVGDICAMQKGWIEIAPASAWPGDVIELPGHDENDRIGCLAVVLTNGRALAYHPDQPEGAHVGQPQQYQRGWHLPWRPEQ